jgi:hypothetical protein
MKEVKKSNSKKLLKLGHLLLQWVAMLILIVLALNGAQEYWQGNPNIGSAFSIIFVGLLFYASKR